MAIVLGATWRIRGSVAAATGYLLIGVGLVSEFAGLGGTNQLLAAVQDNWLPLPWEAAFVVVGLFVLAAASTGGGVLLVGYSRAARDREDILRLDPLLYPPVRHPLRTWVVVAGVVVVVLLLPAFWTAPLPHSFREELSVGSCAAPAPISVNLPNEAVLTYQWRSTDGAPVGAVYAPTGPPVTTWVAPQGVFLNSTYGYSMVQVHGSPITFWACDWTSPGTTSQRTVLVTGTYYSTLF